MRSSASGRHEAMEREAERLSRREHRNGGGRFRAEIEMDRGFAIPRSPELGFAVAVREPLVKLQRPKYEFERWDWDYFAWPHDRLDANLEMRDSDPKATFEADRKASEGFLNRSTLQLEKHEMDRYMQEEGQENEDGFAASLRFSAPWRRGCAESNPILEHGKAMHGPCAYQSHHLATTCLHPSH